MGLHQTVVTLEDIRQLLAVHYGIDSIQRIDPLAGGDDFCYQIDTPQHQWVLKEMRMNGMNHPEQEPQVAEQLARTGIPVPRYRQTTDGGYVWYRDEKAFHLQQFIPGQRYERNQAPGWLLGEMAEVLGQIHQSLGQLPRLCEGMGTAWYRMGDAGRLRGAYQHTQAIAEQQGETALAENAQYRFTLVPFVARFKLDFELLTCGNTHGDYHIRQLICGDTSIKAVIDLTTACVHPVIWEVIRSYAFADPQCQDGAIDVEHLKTYIAHYLRYGHLNAYDLRMMPFFYYYQLLRSNYIQQYFDADISGKALARDAAIWSTQLCRWFEAHGEALSEELVRSF